MTEPKSADITKVGRLIHFPTPEETSAVTQKNKLVEEYPVSKAYVHMKLRFKKKNGDMEDVFHHFMKTFDKDYPIDPMRKSTDTVRVCKSCGGVLWKRPSIKLTPSVIKRLALQCSLRLKMDHFSSTCDGETEERVYGS